MPTVVHIVTTERLAGVERYVCDVARESARRGWEATVIGGDPNHVPAVLGDTVRWLPGGSPSQALRSLLRLGSQDVCHAHMTVAEAIAVVARPVHRAPVISTRHFAARRGSTRAGRLCAPWIASMLARQVAVSEFVARNVEAPPDAVLTNGVAPSPCLWRPENRTVLVLQRLEFEKDTLIALQAWQASRLFDEGWSLRVVGDGSERSRLEEWVETARVPGVVFTGWAYDVPQELARAGMLLAPAPNEPFGLAVVEAMGAGVPVVASAAGGHLETVGRLPAPSLFRAGDAAAAADGMRALLSEKDRMAASRTGRRFVAAEFTIERHVEQLLVEYGAAKRYRRDRALRTTEASQH